MRLERHTFGPVLRAARERRGVTLKQLSAETKLGVDLWAALEENNLAGWPKRLFARSYVRDYANRIGLDGDEVVNEFCRLFPEWGDRRAERLMRRHAEIVDHTLDWEDLPSEERREIDRQAGIAPGLLTRHRGRLLAVAFDLKVMLTLTGAGMFMGFGFWPSLAVSSVAYTAVATALTGNTFGVIASEWTLKTLKALPATRRLVLSRFSRA
jgi:hypothetical protein